MIERDGNRIIGDSWEELGLDIPASKYTSATDVKIRHCPTCRDLGKRKSNDFSLSVNPAQGVGKCHKCGTAYVVRKEKKETQKVEKSYTPPSRRNLTKLTDEGLKFFTNRRISQDAINAFKVVEKQDNEWGTMVAYPYFFKGELVNIKYKATNLVDGKKRYKQSPNGMHVMFNYDEAKKYNYVIVCEGEEEVLCWFDAGHPCAVSVDSGAPNPNDQIEKKLECVSNCFDLFEDAEVIFIAVDNDDNGRRLEAELTRRFDVDKIRIINFGKHKDANEYVMYEGHEALAALMKSAKTIKMEGVYTVADVQDELWDMYNNGLPKGTTTHMPSIDRVWKWREGEVTLVTGYANEGKSALYDINLPILKSVFEGWPVGLFVPENMPPHQFYEDVIHTYIGKTSDRDVPNFRMTPDEFQKGMEFVNDHFFLVHPEEAHTLENLFKRFDYLVRKHGIRIMIIDPYNKVENLYKGGKTYDLYVGEFMTMLQKFTKKRRLCTILVAHQNKPEKKQQNGEWPAPDPYHVKGGGTFMDMADNVVSTYRPFRHTQRENPLVEVTSHKIKMKKLVAETGSTEIFFNWKTNRFDDPALGQKSPLDKQRTQGWGSRNVDPELPPPPPSDTTLDDDEIPF